MPTQETYTASEARIKMKEIINTAIYQGPVVITRGNDAVAVVTLDLLNRIAELEAKYDAEMADRALNEFKNKGGETLEEVKRELDIE